MNDIIHFSHAIFDVDSTLSIEGLDVLAAQKGVENQVRAITEAGMNGADFRKSISTRLDILRPSRRDMEVLGDWYIDGLVPGAADTIAKLRDANIAVYLVSGGFVESIMPLAKVLHIDPTHVFANRLHFRQDGSYAGYEQENPLANSGGKSTVVSSLALKGSVVNVGDGSTDAEIKTMGYSDRFIFYGAVSGLRKMVAEVADVVIMDRDLSAILPHILRHEDGRIS